MPEQQLATQKHPQESNVANISEYNKPGNNDSFARVMMQMNIANPDDFKKHLAQQWQQAAKQKQLLSVLRCEIDYFREYVENYGEQGASFMLVSVALALKNICDLYDCFLARNDQQGFTIAITGGDPKAVSAIADSLMVAVKESGTEHRYSKISKIVTLSVGVSAVYPQTMANLKGMAKAALNNAKTLGGNKISDNINEVPADVIITTDTATESAANSITEVDLFAAPEAQSASNNAPASRMYRGQVIASESQAHAPRLATGAPNTDKTDSVAEPENTASNSKPAAVRMYRGHVVSS